MFQDLWATIAHDTLYVSSDKNHDLKDGLREIGETLQHCEELTERILEDKD